MKLKKIKKIENLIYTPNNDLDYAFFDFKIWKCIILIIGLLALLVSLIFYIQVTLKLVICLLSLICFLCFPTVNCVLNFAEKRYFNDSIFVVLSSLLCFIQGNRTISILILMLFDLFKFACCYLWHNRTGKLSSAINILPDFASVALDGKATKIKPTRIKKGDICCVYTGEIVPIDGVVAEGETVIDYSNFNSTDLTIAVNKGDNVISGGINKLNPIIIIADCDYSDCFAKRVFDKCDSSLTNSTRETSVTSAFLNIFIPVMLFIIIIYSFIVPLFTHDWGNSLLIASILLLIACPYGITAILYELSYTSIVSIFNHGVLLSTGDLLSSIYDIKTIICNKTATVTDITYDIEDVNPDGVSIDNFLSLVLKVESVSNNAMANSLRKYCNVNNIDVPDGLIAKEIPGKGIEAVLNGTSILVGNASLLFEHNITTKVPDKPGSVIYVAINNKYCGYILFTNKIRKTSFNVVEKLVAAGIQNLVLVSCDLRSIVRPIANTLGFTVTKSEITPEDKSSIADYFINNSTGNNKVLYLGDQDHEIVPSKHADIVMTSDAILNKNILDCSDIVSIGGGFEALPYIIRYALLCIRLSKLQFWLFISSRVILTVFSLFIFKNIAFTLIIVFLVSFIPTVLSSYFYRRAEK